MFHPAKKKKESLVCLCTKPRQGDQAEWDKTCRLMSSPRGKKNLSFVSVC